MYTKCIMESNGDTLFFTAELWLAETTDPVVRYNANLDRLFCLRRNTRTWRLYRLCLRITDREFVGYIVKCDWCCCSLLVNSLQNMIALYFRV